MGGIPRGRVPAGSSVTAEVYDELRRLAARVMRHERRDHTLQATAVVHEAYLRLAQQGQFDSDNPHQFYALAALMIRRVLLAHARRSAAKRRSTATRRVRVEEADTPGSELSFDPLVFDEALSRLERRDPLKAQIVQLRFFAGLT